MKNDLLFIVIADIHMNERNYEIVNNRLEELERDLEYILIQHSKKDLVILFAGDIAFSGKEKEYQLIEDWFVRLREKYSVILTPGNHDHDFDSYEGRTRDFLLDTKINEIDHETISFIKKGMLKYEEFNQRIENPKSIKKNALVSLYEIKNNTVSFHIQALNTAWCSKINEVGGEIKFPVELLMLPEERTCFNLSILHHPLSWFEPNNSKELRNKLLKTNSIILTGHEHQSDNFNVERNGKKTNFIETMPFYDTEIKKNGFITIDVDKKINVSEYIYDESNSTFRLNSNNEVEYNLSINTPSASGYHITSEFESFLNDLGTGFTHPFKDDVSLNDIFIYPNLDNLTEKKKSLTNESSSEILNKYKENIILSGDETSGKTTLLKKFILDSIENNNIPVYIDVTNVKKINFFNMKSLEKILGKQYQSITSNDIFHNKDKVIFLIDSFEYISGDDNAKAKFLDFLNKLSKQIIISVSNAYDITERQIKGDNLFKDGWVNFELLKFGFRLRYELIEKWNKLKPECNSDNNSLYIHNDEAARTINRIIGKSYIPSTPFFLLSMLQTIDSNDVSENKISSYGYYYQYLITSSLGLASIKKENLDEIFNYIQELSYFFFEKKKISASYDEIWDFTSIFCKEYGLRIDCQPRLDLLVKAKILNLKNDLYSFKYPYIYYFFISKYFAQNISEKEILNELDCLVASLHKKSSMSILMFLTHHSKDSCVLEKIVTHSKSIFLNNEPEKFNRDMEYFNDIINMVSKLKYNNIGCNDYRRERESKKDSQNEYSKDENSNIYYSAENDDCFDEASDYSFIKQVNLAFRNSDLLGQLSRNYYGSLKVDKKVELISEAINAPLRALDDILTVLMNDPENVENLIDSALKERGKTNSHDTSKQILFDIISFICFNFVRKISSTIGCDNLISIIEKISKENNSNSMKLIELSIKLDSGKHIEKHILVDYKKELENNRISLHLFKLMILNYMYMFELKTQKKQELCAIAGIHYPTMTKRISMKKNQKAIA